MHRYHQPVSRTSTFVEYDDGLILDREEAADFNYEVGKAAGMQEAESDIAKLVRRFKFDDNDSIEANARRFIGELIGHLDCEFGLLSSAIRSAARVCEDES